MKRFLSFLSVVLVSMVAVISAYAGDQDESRFKVSFSGVLAGRMQTAAPDQNFDFRSSAGLDAWRENFLQEYLVPHGAVYIYDQFQMSLNPYGPRERHSWFANDPFTGKVGDEYLMWAKRTPGNIREHAFPWGVSLEYRTVGSLWASFSCQRSRQTTQAYNYMAEFMRVEEIDYYPPLYTTTGTWWVSSSRHTVASDSQHSLRELSFTVLAKYDLTRSNPYWSVLPQAGADLLLVREQTNMDATNYQWGVLLSGEGQPIEWAHSPTETGHFTPGATDSRYYLRPVAGLSLELFPYKKRSHVAFVADGRYHFGQRTFAYEHENQHLPAYKYGASKQKWTFALGVLAKF